MKKVFSLIAPAILAVGFTACSQSDLLEDNGFSSSATSNDNAIQFGTYMGKTGSTRATGGGVGDITTSSLTSGTHQAAGFGVLSYYTNTDTWSTVASTKIPDFMWNQQVKYSASKWTYSPIKYWPNDFSNTNVDNKEGKGETTEAQGSVTGGGKLSFFAYAPYVNFTAGAGTSQLGKTKVTALSATPASDDGILAITSNDAQKDPSVYYRFSASGSDLDHSVDLLWGLRGNSAGYNLANKTNDTPADYNTDLTKQSVDEQVNFLFKHALAKFGGHNPSTDPSGEMEGVQIVLDIDDGGVGPSTAIYGGTKGDETLVTVEELEIYDITTAVTNSLPGVSGTSDLIKEGWFNISTGVWDLTTNGGAVIKGATYSSQTDKDDTEGVEKREFEKNIKEGTPKAVLTAGVFSKWTNSSDEDITGVTTTPQDVYTTKTDIPALLMIPSSTEDQTLAVRIKYIVRTYDKNLATSAMGEGQWTKVTQTITNKVTIPHGALKENTFYKLLIHLGLTSVKFTASVVDWNDAINGGTGGNINTDSDNDKDIYLPSNTIGYETHTSSVESVSAASVAANATKFYVAPKAGGAFTITLTGTNASATDFNWIVTGFGSGATITKDFSAKTVTITLPDNTTGEPQATTIKINSVDGTPTTYDTTTVTLIQQES